MTPLTREALVSEMASGRTFTFRPFYGHTARADGALSDACFSQWWPAEFEIGGVRYQTAEHFMMAEKARLFGDEQTLELILAEADPSKVKALGRKVTPFDGKRWEKRRFDAVTEGSIGKFSSTEMLRSYLLGTGDDILVEAAPRDTIWGIGLGRDNPRVHQPDQWRGLNLLGFALIRARESLRAG